MLFIFIILMYRLFWRSKYGIAVITYNIGVFRLFTLVIIDSHKIEILLFVML